jgi:hypothetical protein
VHLLRHADADDGLYATGNHHYRRHDPHRRAGRVHAPQNLHRWPRLPADVEPSRIGYSIGRWIDEDGDGKFDTLVVETRNFRGQRAFDQTGIPLHEDNQTIVKERIYLDKTNRNVLHDEITVIDHALTRPWTVAKKYVRDPSTRPIWIAWDCAEGNPHVRIGNEDYMVSADGLLMPAKKDQAPPDLRFFKQPQK